MLKMSASFQPCCQAGIRQPPPFLMPEPADTLSIHDISTIQSTHFNIKSHHHIQILTSYPNTAITYVEASEDQGHNLWLFLLICTYEVRTYVGILEVLIRKGSWALSLRGLRTVHVSL